MHDYAVLMRRYILSGVMCPEGLPEVDSIGLGGTERH